jgi:hypothetical protein
VRSVRLLSESSGWFPCVIKNVLIIEGLEGTVVLVLVSAGRRLQVVQMWLEAIQFKIYKRLHDDHLNFARGDIVATSGVGQVGFMHI